MTPTHSARHGSTRHGMKEVPVGLERGVALASVLTVVLSVVLGVLLGLFAGYSAFKHTNTATSVPALPPLTDLLSSRSATPTDQHTTQDLPRKRIEASDIQAIATVNSGFERRVHYHAIAARLPPAELAAVMDLIRTELSGSARTEAALIVLSRLAELDVAHAVEFITSADDFEPAWFELVFQEFARQDRDAAVDQAMKLTMKRRIAAATGIIGAMELAPMQEKYAVAISLKAVKALHLQPTEFAEAWHHAAGVTNLLERYPMMQQILAKWGEFDPAAALTALKQEKFNAGQFRQTQLTIIDTWALAAPRDAIDWILHNQLGRLQRSALQTAFAQLATQDMALAMTTLAEVPDALQPGLKRALLPAMLSDDLDGTLSQIEQNPEADKRKVEMGIAAAVLLQTDPDELRYWTSTLSKADQENVTAYVIASTRYSEPDIALEMLDTYTDGQQRIKLANTMISQWARRDPQSAAAWVANQSNDAIHFQPTLVRSWTRVDADAAVAYALTLQTSIRDTALHSAIGSRRNPDAQRRAFNAIEGSATKRAAARSLARVLDKTDPTEAARLRTAYPAANKQANRNGKG